MSVNGPTEGELLIMKRLDFIAEILLFDVKRRTPDYYDLYPHQRELWANLEETREFMKEAGMLDEN